MMAPRFKIDTYIHMYNFEDLCRITRRRENKTSGNEGLDGENGKKIWGFLVILYELLVDDAICLFPLKAPSRFWLAIYLLVHTNILLHTQNEILLP